MSRSESTPSSREDAAVDSTVVRRIAEREGCATTELPPLYDVIDPDALNTIVGGGSTTQNRRDVRVSFTYCGYEVNVGSETEVRVREATEAPEGGENRDEASATPDAT